MKILHVIPGLTRERGGPSSVLQSLVAAQARMNHEIAVVTTDQGVRHGEEPIALEPSVHLKRCPVWGSDRLAYAPTVSQVLREIIPRSDIIHIHSIFTYPVHTALREAMKYGVPTIIRPCGQLHPTCVARSSYRKRLYLQLFGKMVRSACDAWHYTSARESDESWPHDGSPSFVAPNGIESDSFEIEYDEARARVNVDYPELDNAPYVLFLGRIHPIKRLDVLLPAFLRGAPEHFKLVIAGPDESGLRAKLSLEYLSGRNAARVLWLDTVDGASKIALLAGAELFALASEHENFGLAALEALAAGTPTLLSPHVDIAQAVVEAGLGYTAPLDIDSWAHKITSLLQTTLDRGQRKQAKAWAIENYSWSRIARQVTSQYRWVQMGCPARHKALLGPIEDDPLHV